MTVTLRRKRLKKVLAKADTYEFLTMIWAANSLRQQEPKKGLVYLTVPDEIIHEITKPPESIHGWDLETLANEAFIHSAHMDRSARRLNCGNWAGFATVYDALQKLSDAESVIDLIDDDIASAMPRIMWNQLQWSVGFSTAQYFYRFWYLYSSTEADAVMRAKYGISLEQFCFTGFATFSQIQRKPWSKLQPLPKYGIDTEDLDAFLRVTSRSISLMRSHATKIRSPSQGKRHIPIDFHKSALRDYPIVSRVALDGIYYCAPLPELVFARITEGLFFDLKGDGGLGNNYGRRFERYVFDLIDFRLSSLLTIEPEYEYRKGMKSPDVLVADNERRLKLVVECKTLNLGMPIRQSPDPWKTHQEYFEAIISGVVQIWRYCEFVQSKKKDKFLPDLSLARGVLMTLHPWFVVDLNKREAVMAAAEAEADEKGISKSSRIPVGFMHAEDLERTVSLLDSDGFLQAIDEISLPKYHDYETRETWKSLFGKDRRTNSVEQFPFGQKLGEIMPWWKNVGKTKPV
ncbi:hypothetical protein [uncultured Tateyamaria sp.]|uniref:hypothetical protein n=1 Tax=uncultured Tateyamaria sp. TaxID=455651 RepID=UPI00261F744C|nr:hypothetical protein [uncultured Tateyamaria sp.]